MDIEYDSLMHRILTKDTILIVLAGSRLSGESSPSSDYDFFIITHKTDKVRIENTKGGKKIEAFYYSVERIENCISVGDAISIDAFATGKVLFEGNKALASKILKKILSAHSDFKISSMLKEKLRYRFDMLREKIESTDYSDEAMVRLLNIYFVEYIFKTLFYINGKVHPSIKQMRQRIMELKQLPARFSEKFNILLGIEKVEPGKLKEVMIDCIDFIQDKIGHSKDVFEFTPSKTDTTKVI